MIVILGAIAVIAGVSLLVDKYICKNSALKAKIIGKVKEKVFFNTIIRSILASYLKTCISSIQQINEGRWSGFEQIGSSLTAILMLLVMVLLIPFFYFVLFANLEDLQDSVVRIKIESLYLNLDVRRKTVKRNFPWTIPLFLMRRLIYSVFILVMLRGHAL